jgi:hypothetical protein
LRFVVCLAVPPSQQVFSLLKAIFAAQSRDSTPVSKRLVANYALVGNTIAIKRVFGDPVLWMSIFTQREDQFCAASEVCRGLSGNACKKEIDACKQSRGAALISAEILLDTLAADSKSMNPSFRMSATLTALDTAARMRAYFSTAEDSGIECVAPKTPKVPQSPAAADSSPLRVRGVSNDLLIGRDHPSFSSTSQATLNVSGDHSTTQTRNVKATGAVGYAFTAGLTTVVPYVSFYQSITDVQGKAESVDPTSFIAGGMMFTAIIPGDKLVQSISAKPQFLKNTKDQSEIGSLTLLYKPFTAFDVSRGGFNLNDPRPLPFWPSTYGEILFDLRADIGQYTDRGNDPVQRLLNQGYARAGTHFGISLTVESDGPSLTLTVAETYLYGFSGSVRNLDLFETSLTYNFDPKKYVGLKVSYTKGRNEDTALAVQTWLVGLSARY